MKIKSLKLICFSPTGTTKKIAQSIINGLGVESVDTCDLTKQGSRQDIIETKYADLLMVAVPVYMGRVPDIISSCLETIKAQNQPVVCLVVYGNRTYGNSLLELNDILLKRGCFPIAGGAFIGEHSFSSKELPVAQNRPNLNDLQIAQNFGSKIKEKLSSIKLMEEMPKLEVSGEYPYGGVTELWSVDFIDINEKCTQKGICSEVCPTGAINKDNTKIIDTDKCISCCACIKKCPNGARTIKNSKVKDAAIRLNKMFSELKHPELFY